MNIASKESPFSYNLLWLSLGLFVIVLVAVLLPVTASDYWWYVRLGSDVLQSGSVPTVETYSYTRAGQAIVHPSWLSGVFFWLVYQAGGLTLTFITRGVLLAVTYTLLWLLSRQLGAGPRLATLIVLLSALSGANNWSIRPQLFTYPLFAASLWILWRWNQGKKTPLWLLPLFSAIWVNLHGSFAILFGLLGLALLFGGGDRKALLAWSLGAFVATLLNPRGFGAWQQMVFMMNNPSIQNLSIEWAPPTNTHWQMNIFFGWLLAGPLLVVFSTRRPARLVWIWYLALGWMALSSIRYVIWFLFLLIPITASLLADLGARYLDRPVNKIYPAANFMLSAAFVLLALAAAPGIRQRWWSGPDIPLYWDTPVQATQWLQAHPELPGPLWSDLVFSSYLIFAVPERPVWIDPRFEVYPPEQWRRYIAINDAAPQWQALLDHDNVNLLFLSLAGQPALAAAVQASPVWCEQYKDTAVAIFSRCKPK